MKFINLNIALFFDNFSKFKKSKIIFSDNFYLFELLLITSFSINSSYAQLESRTNREAIISSYNKKFYQSNRSRQYISFLGNYSSDYNSSSYQLNSRYLFMNSNYSHEINAQHQVDYADTGSGKTKKYNVKKSELYDLAIASKMRLFKGNNYTVFYHRSIYDKFSVYLYDQRSALGFGRAFNNDKIELDLSLAYRDVKTYSYEINYIASLRLNHKINNKISLIQRSYIFFNKDNYDQEYRTSFVYRLNQQLSFELRHNFEKRRYVDFVKKNSTNLITRGISFGIVVDLY